MITIKNIGYQQFKKYIENKKIYIWGAGRALESCIDLYFDNKEIEKVIDNDEKLWGTVIKCKNRDISIFGLNDFLREVKINNNLSEIVLMISSSFYAVEIVEMLDSIPELDGLECVLQVLIRNKKEAIESYDFTKGEQKIPKKIHYIWIGGNPLPEKFVKNIETWKKYNPDYEIIQWDESNYDFEKCDYVREAYESKAWSFASNYARLDIIHQQGGIYLDTDVEIVNNFDRLLNDEAFVNMGYTDRINIGCGFGAIEKHPMIYEMLNRFNNSHFILSDGKQNKRPFHTYLHPVAKKYGFEISNKYQKIKDIVLYPCEVMSPLTIGGMEDFISEKTVSIHQEIGAWKTEKEKEGMEKLKKLIKERL